MSYAADDEQDKSQQVGSDDGGQGRIDLPGVQCDCQERDDADKSCDKGNAMKRRMKRCIGEECGQEAEQDGAMPQQDCKIWFLDADAVKGFQPCRAKNPDDWQRVNEGDDQEHGWNDETHEDLEAQVTLRLYFVSLKGEVTCAVNARLDFRSAGNHSRICHRVRNAEHRFCAAPPVNQQRIA